MLLRTLAVLCLVAAAQAGYGSYPYPQPQRCGWQRCYPPNRCEYRDGGLSVCVLPHPPTCAATTCAYGYECVLQQHTCTSRPCKPQPTCIKKGQNPCGLCSGYDKFCELYPKYGSPATCRFVVEPRCDNKICTYGKQCKEEPLQCIYPPCPINLVCRRPYGYGYNGSHN